jgi:hypothetical protein
VPHKRKADRKAYQKAYQAKHREQSRAACRKYYREHKPESAARNKQWREQNKEQVKTTARAWYSKNRARVNARRRELYRTRRQLDPEEHRRRIFAGHLMSKCGLTVADFDSILIKQKGVCALCRQPMEFGGRIRRMRVVVDHDHVTGKVRGLIHDRCNKLLGFASDDIDLLRRAISYLRRTQ